MGVRESLQEGATFESSLEFQHFTFDLALATMMLLILLRYLEAAVSLLELLWLTLNPSPYLASHFRRGDKS